MWDMFRTGEGRVELQEVLREVALREFRTRAMTPIQRPWAMWPRAFPAFELYRRIPFQIGDLLKSPENELIDPNLFDDRILQITLATQESLMNEMDQSLKDLGNYYTYEVRVLAGLADDHRLEFIVTTYWSRIRFLDVEEEITHPTLVGRP